MDYSAIRDEFEIESQLYSYHTLNRWLSYEGYSIFIWGGGFFLPMGPVALIAALAAIAFVPIMIRELLSVGRPGWIVGWAAWVALPTLLTLIFGPEKQGLLITSFVFLPTSYVYFWVLKMAVDTRVGQLSGHLEFLRGRNSGQP